MVGYVVMWHLSALHPESSARQGLGLFPASRANFLLLPFDLVVAVGIPFSSFLSFAPPIDVVGLPLVVNAGVPLSFTGSSSPYDLAPLGSAFR
jgi:hypothetical protein